MRFRRARRTGGCRCCQGPSVAIACVLAILASAGCGDDDDDDKNPIEPSTPRAGIVGRVDGDSGHRKSAAEAAIDDAIVTLARVSVDGSLEAVSVDSVRTDPQGRFTLGTDAGSERDLVVVARKDGVTWKSVVAAETVLGDTIASQLLNDESTIEAEVHARVIAHGTPNATVYTDIATDIDANVAALIRGSAEKIDDVASAIEAEAETHVLLLSDPSTGVIQAQIEDVGLRRVEAREKLEDELAVREDSLSIALAVDRFYVDLVQAHGFAGIPLRVAALAREAGARALARSPGALDEATRFALLRGAALGSIHFIDAVVVFRMGALGGTLSERSDAQMAGFALERKLFAATSFADLDSAFADYHDEVLAILQTVVETQAAAIGTLDEMIRGTGGARPALEASVGMASSTAALGDAYLAFQESVTTLALASLLGANTADATAIADVLTVINMTFPMD